MIHSRHSAKANRVPLAKTFHHGFGKYLVRGRKAGRFRRNAIHIFYQRIEVVRIVHGFRREGVDRDTAVGGKKTVAQRGRQLRPGSEAGLAAMCR